MFYVLFVRKKFFHPNLRRGSPEKMFSEKFFLPPPPLTPARQHFWGKYGKKYGKIGKNMEKLEKYGKIGKNMEKYGTVVILAGM